VVSLLFAFQLREDKGISGGAQMGFFSAGPLFRGLWIVFSIKSLEKFKNYNHNQVEIRVIPKKSLI
jgi:hypothetical protein